MFIFLGTMLKHGDASGLDISCYSPVCGLLAHQELLATKLPICGCVQLILLSDNTPWSA